eukprot:2374119-Pyramimonas_sp.AAC.1
MKGRKEDVNQVDQDWGEHDREPEPERAGGLGPCAFAPPVCCGFAGLGADQFRLRSCCRGCSQWLVRSREQAEWATVSRRRRPDLGR